MKAHAVVPEHSPQHIERRCATSRKLVQQQHRAELEKDMPSLKLKVAETEGPDMRETIQDKINAWFVENRHPENGEYPDFPAVEEGGCAPAHGLL